jgi:arylsulfatase A-like enzyme
MKKHAANPARDFAFDVGLVLASWALLLALENFVVGVGWREQFVASWEMGHARRFLSPIALGAAFPLALVAVLVARLVEAGRSRHVAVLALLGGAAVGWGVSTGRHFAMLPLRGTFTAVVAIAAGAAAMLLARRAKTAGPRIVAVAGAVVVVLAWLADLLVLPRLYPVFHSALLVFVLGGAAATTAAIANRRVRNGVSLFGLLLVTICLAWTPRAAHDVRGDDNLRRVLYEHAPLLGRAVVVAARIAPPPPIDDADDAALTAASLRQTGQHALDWRGHDIVLVTIDALRADHVSAYGYARKTTPNLDRLAAEGARFDHAYCPTPHTSYSVSSMMTGKYMRPLLAMGAGQGSETWPLLLRRYGYQTAAFYPPAVFFIDEDRFTELSKSHLSFEYYKVEFAKPELRRAQIDAWLAASAKDATRPRFLWMHLFEPHEPYEMHPEHPFSGNDTFDAYDSEIAVADELLGQVVDDVRKVSPNAIVIATADHGEEFGDHGGRYHGTTVYEEQVRVPLIVVGPGVAKKTVAAPVQTIDLLPTTLAALDIPLPARIRGRDLGATLAGKDEGEGLAFSETEDWTLVARGADRLVCQRKLASCTLFDAKKDPAETHPISDRPERVTELRKLGAAIERENGRLEGTKWPDALRRAMQGDRDAAEDIAPLLDDADPTIRRAAARAAFRLRAKELAPQLARAAQKDEDALVKAWASLALARVDATPTTDAQLTSSEPDLRFAAALVLAEHGDAKGESILVERFDARRGGELEDARELLAAFAKIKAKSAVPALVRALEDVRLRPYIVDALGAIGDPRAKQPLLEAFTEERYVHIRPLEARALVALGAREELRAPLARFAGVPEPMTEALAIARDAKLLDPKHGGAVLDAERDVTLTVPSNVPLRVLAERAGKVTVTPHEPSAAGTLVVRAGPGAVWVVPRAEEIPPPPPEKWDPDDAGPP